MQNSAIEEILDIVDDTDIIIGQVLRSDIYKNNSLNFRVINGFLINSQKRYGFL